MIILLILGFIGVGLASFYLGSEWQRMIDEEKYLRDIKERS